MLKDTRKIKPYKRLNLNDYDRPGAFACALIIFNSIRVWYRVISGDDSTGDIAGYDQLGEVEPIAQKWAVCNEWLLQTDCRL